MNKTRPTYICFKKSNKNYLNQFLIFSNPKILPYFLFFFFVLARQYFFSYLSRPSRTLSHIFLPNQSAVWPTEPISFSHLRLPDASRRLQTPRPPSYSSLCHLPQAPWRHLASSLSSPKKWMHPIASPSMFPSPVTDAIEVPPPLPPSP
jgi:hypothetical protein